MTASLFTCYTCYCRLWSSLLKF